MGRKLRPSKSYAILLFIFFGLFLTGVSSIVELIYDRKSKKNSFKKNKSGNKKSVVESSFVLRSKRKIKDYLNNEPPRVKDLAVQKGPYPILKKLEDAFESAKPAPRVLVLGDSVHYRISRDDVDKRTLAEMLENQFVTNGIDALCLNYSAYHPGIYVSILRALNKMRQKPYAVVLPINLRCFSPQWYLHPDHTFVEEIRILDNYYPGSTIPEVFRERAETEVEAFDSREVNFPDSHLTTIGQFRLVAKAESRSAYQEAWRARQIAIFHYLYSLTSEHPLLSNALAMIRVAHEAGIKPLVYLTPINYMHGIRAVGESFSKGTNMNVELVKSTLMPEINNAQGCFYDWSREFSDAMFFHPQERTEHLNESGRIELTRRIIDAVSKV